MSSFQELLVIAGIILGIIFLPRMTSRMPTRPRIVRPKTRMSGKMRVVVAASIIYPALAAAYFKPWQEGLVLFCYLGIGPVALGWMTAWIFAGFKNKS
jgi:hypothetical protein